MSRKRTPDQPSTESGSTAAVAEAEPEPTSNSEPKQTFAERVGQRRERLTAPDPFSLAGDYVVGVQLFESKRDRQMAIKFNEKPGQAVIDKLKDSGYRWNGFEKVWTHPVPHESALSTRIGAERLYQELRQMLREEKGIESGPEIPF